MRNGYCKPKDVRTKYGNIKIKTPRDRNATFKPVIIEKGQTKLDGFEEKCIALYAKGVSLRDIEKTLKEMYGVKINKDEITKLISAVSEETEKWRNRKLKPMYVFTYADCLYVPIKDDLTTSKKAIYVIIGVDVNGYKEILGMWIDGTESASFWSNVFEDLKERGVEDILYMSSDGVAGFKGSLERVFPKTQSQRCVVHLVRNIYSLCPKKDAKEIIADYKKIYTSSTLEEANFQLEVFKNKYNKEQKRIVKKAEDFMQYLEPLFELPQEIRKSIYTSNAVESVNSALRKVTRGKGAFPNENSVYKILYLRIKELSEKWKKPIQNWKIIQPQLIELFGDRYTKHLKL
jgi:transposase-like protein